MTVNLPMQRSCLDTIYLSSEELITFDHWSTYESPIKAITTHKTNETQGRESTK
jgi:hypothetical protein